MARQVAHEIKNPLTPIQLSAEHLRRVHADRGTPLSPVLDECVDSILTPGAAAPADCRRVLELRLVAHAAAGRDQPGDARGRGGRALPRGARRPASRSRSTSRPTCRAVRGRSHADRPRADQHHRERAARHARRRRAGHSAAALSADGRAVTSADHATPASAWTPPPSRASSSRTSRPRPSAPASASRSRSGTWRLHGGSDHRRERPRGAERSVARRQFPTAGAAACLAASAVDRRGRRRRAAGLRTQHRGRPVPTSM